MWHGWICFRQDERRCMVVSGSLGRFGLYNSWCIEAGKSSRCSNVWCLEWRFRSTLHRILLVHRLGAQCQRKPSVSPSTGRSPEWCGGDSLTVGGAEEYLTIIGLLRRGSSALRYLGAPGSSDLWSDDKCIRTNSMISGECMGLRDRIRCKRPTKADEM